MKPKLRSLFDTYAEYHRHPINELTHIIAIPLIVFHILAMLDWIAIGPVTGGIVLYVSVVLWYLTLDVGLAVIMALLFAPFFPLARLAPVGVVIAAAVVGWIIQLAGHVVWEKRQPAFLVNLQQLFVGPLYFVAKAIGRYK